MKQAPLLQLSQVSVHLGGRALLKEIDLSLMPGECVAIIGPSGAGKSTLLQLLAGVCPGRLEGQFERFGQPAPLTRDPRISLLPQGLADNLNPHMTLEAHLREGLQLQGRLSTAGRRSRIRDLMQRVALPQHLLSRYPRHLSGGEIQRALLALALLGEPQVLLLDEPTAALDSHTREMIQQQLQRERKQRAIVLVTHDMALARKLADRVILMRQGQILRQGSVAACLPAQESSDAARQSALQADSTGKPILEVEHLGLSYRGRHLFREFRMRLMPRELVLVRGASGTGKTTLARLLAGWDPLPPGARLTCRGRCLLLAQHPRTACAAHFSLLQILAEPLKLARHPIDREQINFWLQQVQLPCSEAFLQRYPHSLSGGELQRLLLARAMLAEPDLLIADEPTSALDPVLRDEIAAVLLRVQQRSGCTLLIFTHDERFSALTGVPARQLTASGLLPEEEP